MKGENCVSDGIRVLNAADIKTALPPRKAVSNKGDYGRAAIAAGCMRYGGGACGASRAVRRRGVYGAVRARKIADLFNGQSTGGADVFRVPRRRMET